MTTGEEYMRILKMVEAGKITAEEAARLMAALDDSRRTAAGGGSAAAGEARWFRVRVSDTATGKTRVNVNLPVGLLDIGLKMGARLSPEVEGLDVQQIVSALKSGLTGKIVDVTDEDDGQHVEVFVE